MVPKNYFILSFLLVLLLSDYCIHGYEAGYCSSISLTINAYSNAENKLVYVYMADLDLSPADPYHTNITVSRQFSWSSDPNLYYQNVSSWPGCTSVDEDCTFTYEDGVIWQSYNVWMGGELVVYDLMTWYMIDQGTYYGLFEVFDPKQPPCQEDVGGNVNYGGRYTYCCKKYTYFTIPEVSNPCTELSGITTFYDLSNNTLSIFETNYVVLPEGINFTITGNLIGGDRGFEIDPNYFGACGGSAEFPTCSWFFGVPTNIDYQLDMYFYSYYASDKFWAAQIIMNKFITRNGLLMQNQSQPFTPEDPCTPELSPPNYYEYYGEPVTKVSLCCTKFQQPTDSSVLVKQKLQNILADAKKMQQNTKESTMLRTKRLLPGKKQRRMPLKQRKNVGGKMKALF